MYNFDQKISKHVLKNKNDRYTNVFSINGIANKRKKFFLNYKIKIVLGSLIIRIRRKAPNSLFQIHI